MRRRLVEVGTETLHLQAHQARRFKVDQRRDHLGHRLVVVLGLARNAVDDVPGDHQVVAGREDQQLDVLQRGDALEHQPQDARA